MEQQSPLHPMPKDEAAQKSKRAILPSLKFIGREGRGEGAEKFSISSVLDCSLVEFYR